MPPCARRVKIDMRVDLWPARGTLGVLGDNSAATAKWRWTCSHVADAAPEWPALLAATTTATLMLRADPSYPTVALFHVSLTLRKNLKRRAAESPTSLGYPGSGPVCGERTLATAQKLSERTNRARIISICPLHNIVGV